MAVWQRNYHELIVRSDAELDRIRRYLAESPFNWVLDPENPDIGAGGAGPFGVMARSSEGRDESRPFTAAAESFTGPVNERSPPDPPQTAARSWIPLRFSSIDRRIQDPHNPAVDRTWGLDPHIGREDA
jgi:hypothetical protein